PRSIPRYTRTKTTVIRVKLSSRGESGPSGPGRPMREPPSAGSTTASFVPCARYVSGRTASMGERKRLLRGPRCGYTRRHMRKIMLMTTGGTIEKTYDERTGELSNRQSIVRRMLRRLRLEDTEVTILELMSKDSLDLTPG